MIGSMQRRLRRVPALRAGREANRVALGAAASLLSPAALASMQWGGGPDRFTALVAVAVLALYSVLVAILLLLRAFRWWLTVLPVLAFGAWLIFASFGTLNAVRHNLYLHLGFEEALIFYLPAVAAALFILAGPPAQLARHGRLSFRWLTSTVLRARLREGIAGGQRIAPPLLDPGRDPRVPELLRPFLLMGSCVLAALTLLPGLSGGALRWGIDLRAQIAGGGTPDPLSLWLLTHIPDWALFLEGFVVCFPVGWLLGSARRIVPLLALPAGATVGLGLSLLLPHSFPLDAWLGPNPLPFLLVAVPSLAVGAGLRRRRVGQGRSSG